MNNKPRVAIIHDYLNAHGGQEDVTNAIWELWPDAPIYTALWDPSAFKETGAFKGATIRVPKWATNRFVNKFYKYFTFLYPLMFQSLNLKDYDIVISSSANFAKGVTTGKNQIHISYIHTPPRFLYGYPTETSKRDFWYWNIVLKPLDFLLRLWDQEAARRPNFLVCNSTEVLMRIKKFYGRDATIIHPFPVIKEDLVKNDSPKGDYYLVISRISRYKNVDKVVKACAFLKRKLIIAGTGKNFADVKKIVDEENTKGANIETMGFVSEEKKAQLLASCRAFIYNVSQEDFGIAPLEAMYFGKPCIVPNEGGFKDTVCNEYNGVFSKSVEVVGLIEAIKKFENLENKIDWKKNCQKTASMFTKEKFQREFKQFVEEKWRNHA